MKGKKYMVLFQIFYTFGTIYLDLVWQVSYDLC